MRIAFSPALPVGALSECEWFDLMLTSLVPVEEALGALVDASPRELAPTRAAYVDPRSPALGAWLDRVDWEIRLVGGGLTVDCVRAALDDVVSSGHVDYLRSGKPRTVDLRRTLVSCDVRGTGPDVLLGFKTRSSNDGALRPDVLAGAILGDSRLEGASCELMDVRKIGQWHEGEDGLISPLDLAVTTSA
jgi:radical SAM-linked protein